MFADGVVSDYRYIKSEIRPGNMYELNAQFNF